MRGDNDKNSHQSLFFTPTQAKDCQLHGIHCNRLHQCRGQQAPWCCRLGCAVRHTGLRCRHQYRSMESPSMFRSASFGYELTICKGQFPSRGLRPAGRPHRSSQRGEILHMPLIGGATPLDRVCRPDHSSLAEAHSGIT